MPRRDMSFSVSGLQDPKILSLEIEHSVCEFLGSLVHAA